MTNKFLTPFFIRFSEFGTILEIKDWVLKADGCSILSTVGLQRFRVQSRGERDGYDTAQVEFVNDVPIPNNRLNGKLNVWFEMSDNNPIIDNVGRYLVNKL